MGIPLSTDGIPSKLRGTMWVYRKTVSATASQGVSSQVFGPYSFTSAPIRGDVMLGEGGAMIDADERWYVSTSANVQINDVVQRLETQQNWTCVYVQAWPSHIEIFVKRIGASIAGNK